MKWKHKFFENSSELLEFLSSLTIDQAAAAKVLNGRKAGYAIYGWDIFYPDFS